MVSGRRDVDTATSGPDGCAEMVGSERAALAKPLDGLSDACRDAHRDALRVRPRSAHAPAQGDRRAELLLDEIELLTRGLDRTGIVVRLGHVKGLTTVTGARAVASDGLHIEELAGIARREESGPAASREQLHRPDRNVGTRPQVRAAVET